MLSSYDHSCCFSVSPRKRRPVDVSMMRWSSAPSHRYTHWGLVGCSRACDTIRTPWRHGQWVNSPESSQLELESAKQRTSPGKPEPDEDDNLKQVDPIPGTFKSYTLSTLHTCGTRYPQIVVQGCRFSALTRS